MKFFDLAVILSCLTLSGLLYGGFFQLSPQENRADGPVIGGQNLLAARPGPDEGRSAGVSRAAVFEPSPAVSLRRGQFPDRPNRKQSDDFDCFVSSGNNSPDSLVLHDYRPAWAGAADWPAMPGPDRVGLTIFGPGERPLVIMDRHQKFLVWLRSLLPLVDFSRTLSYGEGNLFA